MVTKSVPGNKATAQTGPFKFLGMRERIEFLVGSILALLTVPPVAAVIGSTVLWEAIDRGFKGGLVESNNELTGLIFGRIVPWITRVTAPFNKRLVKNPDDSFLPNAAVFFVFGLPLLLTSFGRWHHAYEGQLGTQLWDESAIDAVPFAPDAEPVNILCMDGGGIRGRNQVVIIAPCNAPCNALCNAPCNAL